jgi:putative sporulation protein YyaC
VVNISEGARNILASFNTFSTYNLKEKQAFITILRELSYEKNIIFACIGTDRATGDCLGPLVGTNLQRLGYTVCGTLEEPLHAQNLTKRLQQIRASHNPDLILAIDASLGRIEDIGKISLANSPLKPGAGVQKNLPPIGDLSVLGTVNIGGLLDLEILQCTRLHTVMKLSTDITNLVWQAIPSPRLKPRPKNL